MDENGGSSGGQNLSPHVSINECKRKKLKALVGKKKLRYFNSSKSLERTLHRSKQWVSSKIIISSLRSNNRALAKMVQQCRNEVTSYYNVHTQDVKEKYDINLRNCQLEQELARVSSGIENEVRRRCKEKLELLKIVMNKGSNNMAEAINFFQEAVNMCSTAEFESRNDQATDVSANSANSSCTLNDDSEKSTPPLSMTNNTTDEHSSTADICLTKKTIYDLSIIEESPTTPRISSHVSCERKSSRHRRSKSLNAIESEVHLEELNKQAENKECEDCDVFSDSSNVKEDRRKSERHRSLSSIESKEIDPCNAQVEATCVKLIPERVKKNFRRETFVVLNSKQTAPWPPERPADYGENGVTTSKHAKENLSPEYPNLFPQQDLSKISSRDKSPKRSKQTPLPHHPPSNLTLTADKEAVVQASKDSAEVIEEKIGDKNITNVTPEDMELTAVVDYSIVNGLEEKAKTLDTNADTIGKKAQNAQKPDEERMSLSRAMQPMVLIERCFPDNDKNTPEKMGMEKREKSTKRVSFTTKPPVVVGKCIPDNGENTPEVMEMEKREKSTKRVSVAKKPKIKVETCIPDINENKYDVADVVKAIEDVKRVSGELEPRVVIEKWITVSDRKKSSLAETQENVGEIADEQSNGSETKKRKSNRKMQNGRKKSRKGSLSIEIVDTANADLTQDSDNDKQREMKRKRDTEKENGQISVAATSSTGSDETATKSGRVRTTVNYKLPSLNSKMRNATGESLTSDKKTTKTTKEKKTTKRKSKTKDANE